MSTRTRRTASGRRPARPRRPRSTRRPTGVRRPPRRPSPRTRRSGGRSRRGLDLRARLLALLLVLLVLAAGTVQLLRSGPGVVTGVMPGSFTGYAFDACEAPSQRQMDAWRERSPYWAVGIYIAGENRACARQPHLDRDWVANQARQGWRLLPLSVGRQAPCIESSRVSRIDPSRTDGYAAARGQGRDEADGAADAARDLGIAPGSTLWLDVEAFDVSRARCRAATLAYVSSWTRGLRERGFRSGVYASASSGIRMLEQARSDAASTYALPRQIWFGDWNQRHDTEASYLSRGGWPGGRVHQYAGTHRETYGGVTLEIDSDFLDVGRGTVAPPERSGCRPLRGYPTLRVGDRSSGVVALQCLLRQRHLARRDPVGEYTSATAQAVAGIQRAHGLAPSGVTDRRTWAVLVSDGSRPLLKFGSGGDAVRRLQRGLSAAGAARLPATGVFGGRTAAAVKSFQRAHRLPPTGVVTVDVWRLLQGGR